MGKIKMKKIKMEVELEYDEELIHGNDPESIDWFYHEVLLHPSKNGELILHSNEIGDEVGVIRVLKVMEVPME